MNIENKRMCGFYISDVHLSTMIFPYIMKNINEDITTILEVDIDKYINKLLKNTNFKNDVKEKIQKINWERTNEDNFQNKLDQIQDNSYIIVAGKSDYINKINEFLNKKVGDNKNITIIKCYDIDNFNLNVNNIINENEYVLNTAGEIKKEEFFSEKNKKIN